jgi:hypothetical protein
MNFAKCRGELCVGESSARFIAGVFVFAGLALTIGF